MEIDPNRLIDMSEKLAETGVDEVLIRLGADPTALTVDQAKKLFFSLADFDVEVTLRGHEWEMLIGILDLSRGFIQAINPALARDSEDFLASLERQASLAVNTQDPVAMAARVEAAFRA